MSQASANDLLSEAERIPFRGWDFSVLGERLVLEPPPWSFEAIIDDAVLGSTSTLDMGTGGARVVPHQRPMGSARVPRRDVPRRPHQTPRPTDSGDLGQLLVTSTRISAFPTSHPTDQPTTTRATSPNAGVSRSHELRSIASCRSSTCRRSTSRLSPPRGRARRRVRARCRGRRGRSRRGLPAGWRQ